MRFWWGRKVSLHRDCLVAMMVDRAHPRPRPQSICVGCRRRYRDVSEQADRIISMVFGERAEDSPRSRSGE